VLANSEADQVRVCVPNVFLGVGHSAGQQWS